MKTCKITVCLALLLCLLSGCLFAQADTPPEARYDEWNLILVNENFSVPADWESDLVSLRGGEQVDRRILEDLQAMFDDCRDAGLHPIVYSGYRSRETQQEIYDRRLTKNILSGHSPEEAEALTREWVSLPGTSEHQLGLAVDIDSEDAERCPNEDVWAWLLAHCADYGFILRYPADKTELTGIAYEPWHFRYVGREAAQAIMSAGLVLEEYLQ